MENKNEIDNRNGCYFFYNGECIKESCDCSKAMICQHFGCGKKLSPTEYLFSEYCFKHALIINQNKTE